MVIAIPVFAIRAIPIIWRITQLPVDRNVITQNAMWPARLTVNWVDLVLLVCPHSQMVRCATLIITVWLMMVTAMPALALPASQIIKPLAMWVNALKLEQCDAMDLAPRLRLIACLPAPGAMPA